jgi:hypothetical protein
LLQDSSANPIVVSEGGVVNRDNYLVLGAGGFPHIFQVTSVSRDGSTSAGIDLKDVMSGATTKVTTGPDNVEEAVIDGQTYYINNVSSANNQFTVTWGTSANTTNSYSNGGNPGRGSYHTVWPVMKTQRGARIALVPAAGTNVPLTLSVNATTNSSIVELPSGAVNITVFVNNGGGSANGNWTLTAANREDGTTSGLTAATGSTDVAWVNFQLGRTSSGGGLYYRATRVAASNSVLIQLLGTTNASAPIGNASLVLVEEKDDAGNEGGIAFLGATGTSGSNQLAGVGAVDPSSTDSGALTWGSNSNKATTADIWGTLLVRDTATSAQPFVEVWYPDTQRIASAFVLGKDATTSASSGASGGVVKSAAPVKTALGKLDSEVTSADKSTKNLILVGGPAVNSLVRELADASKTKNRDWYVAQGAGTALIELVADAFASGRSALVVAGHSAADTRAATSALQNYDAYTWSGDSLVLKSGVLSQAPA